MTEQEFAAIKERWLNLEWKDWYAGDWDEQSQDGGILRSAPTDTVTLIRAVEERDAIIHDLMIDGSHLARRAVEEFAAGWVDRLADHGREVAKRTSATNYGKWLGLQYAINLVSALTKLGNIDPLPPDQVRAENERLRLILKAIRDQVEEWQYQIASYGDGGWPVLEDALNNLKEMAEMK